jgi:hypothetical protein
MSWRLDHRPHNREGHPAFRPWRILQGSRPWRAFTTHALAIAALDMLLAGETYSRQEIYRRTNRYGPKSRNNRPA